MQLVFDARQVAPATGPEAVPTDWYTCQIISTTMTPTKDAATSGNAYLDCEVQLMAGPHAGRKLHARMNLKNSSAQAVEIAYKELSAICHATDVLQITDTSQLHNRPLEARIIKRDASGVYDESNEFKQWRKCGTGKTPAGNGGPGGPAVGMPPAGAAAPGFPAQQAPANATPWGGGAAAPAQAAATPWAQPATGAAAPAINVPQMAVAVQPFPPPGWVVHPQNPAYYHNNVESVSEAELRARMAPPVVNGAAGAPVVTAPAAPAQGAAPPWAAR